MKAAICLSGHMRSFNSCYPTLKKSILDIIDCDIFIHSWYNQGLGGRGDDKLINEKIDINEINNLYFSKKILIEDLKNFDTSKYDHKIVKELRNHNIIPSMFYSIYKANELKCIYEKENNFKYDLVIRCRPDIYFDSIFNINEIKKMISIPMFGNYRGINDQFAFGPSNLMNVYSNTFNNLEKYFTFENYINAERLTFINLNYNKVPIYRTNIKYRLLRSDGSFFINAKEKHFNDVMED